VSDRRDRILAAALRVIAAEAGVALASTTYHFSSKQELVRDALAQAVERSVSAVERASAPPHKRGTAPLVERLLALVALLEAEDQAPLAAQFELMLEAGRRPHLRPLAEHWSEAYTAGIERLAAGAGLPDPALAATTISDLIDGALLNQLSLPRDDFVAARLGPALELTVTGLAGQSRAAAR
jgi:AcrR family transcriptional regulator